MVTELERRAQFAKALVNAQSSLTTIQVSSTSFWDVALAPLSDNGLCLSQTIEFGEGKARITTCLSHEGGYRKEHSTEVKPGEDGRIGPLIELLAFHNLIGALGLCAPNEDPAAGIFVPVRAE